MEVPLKLLACFQNITSTVYNLHLRNFFVRARVNRNSGEMNSGAHYSVIRHNVTPVQV
jgi:hypothetical protein